MTGHCLLCGRNSEFYCSDPALARESLICRHCGSTSRHRALARGVLRALRELAGVRSDCVARLPEERPDTILRVYDTQVSFDGIPVAYSLPAMLAACPWLDIHTSRFRPELPSGELLAPDCTNQNLEALTFADASVDLLITSDVMEHVRLARRAHAEIRRVLKTGGIYVFTVPHFRDRRTVERVRILDPEDPSRDEHVCEPEYHLDGNSKEGRVLAYRNYGVDIDDDLSALGFSVQYDARDDAGAGILNSEIFYCRVESAPRV